jgi:hypothetical protein
MHFAPRSVSRFVAALLATLACNGSGDQSGPSTITGGGGSTGGSSMNPAVGAGGSATAFNRLRFALAKNPSTRALNVVEQFLDTITVLPVDRAVERPYGSIRATLERAGHPIGCLDTIIATHALAHA